MDNKYDIIAKSFALSGVFLLESLYDIIIWLIVMFSVIFCDLITGCRKSIAMNEEVRVSSAFRRTMGKMVTYFSFVLMVVLIDNATGGEHNIDKWAILFICLIEFCSIISNILRPKGYELNPIKFISLFLKKIFHIGCEDINTIVKKREDSKQETDK